MNYANVIIKPLITEKSVSAAASGKYTFLINQLATKEDLKLALKKVLNVNPVSINIIRFKNHKRRINYLDPKKGSNKKKSVNYKKAIVQLSQDEKLDYFDVE